MNFAHKTIFHLFWWLFSREGGYRKRSLSQFRYIWVLGGSGGFLGVIWGPSWTFVNTGTGKDFHEASGCLDGRSFGLSQEGIGKGLRPGGKDCTGGSSRVRNKNISSKSNL